MGQRLWLSKDGGRNYRPRWERPVGDRLPSVPAALLVYDEQQRARVVCLDLDSSRGGCEAVDRDHAVLTGLLERCGLAAWFSDHSPNGGRHIYVPLAWPATFLEASAVVRALTAYAPTLDPLPMLNLVAGCIRPPGSYHRSGGHQVLDGPLDAALDAMRRRNPHQAWQRLLGELGVDGPTDGASVGPTDTPEAARPVLADGSVSERLTPLRGFGDPDAGFQAIARTGVYDLAKYATPSEARQAVIWSAVAAGWGFLDVVRRLEDGTWRGLAAFYDRYKPGDRRRAVGLDWRKAIAFEKRRRQKRQTELVRECTTSRQKSQGGSTGAAKSSLTVSQEVRVWLAACELLHWKTSSATVRAVLSALAEAAILSDSLTVDFGNRHLSLGAGKMDKSTVGRILNQLLAEPADRAVIDLVRPAQGVKAHTYQLIVPPLLRPACAAKPFRRGRIHGIRPAFHELGLVAAFVYEALELDRSPASGREIAARAKVSVSAAYEALDTLAAWGLAERAAAGWVLGPASLSRLAEVWGVTDTIQELLRRFRRERAAWLRWLVMRGVIEDPDAHRPPPPEDADLPPPDLHHAQTSLQLVERLLGGTVIETISQTA